jgi:hypothetical protein
MNKMLHRLDSFPMRGSDGRDYVVHGYEHLARTDPFPGDAGQWEPTGVVEYKLADGRPLVVGPQDVMRLPDSGVVLARSPQR